MLKLIIFDWDGTIANSIPKILECKDLLASKFNLPIPDDTIAQKVIGMSFNDALITCFPTATHATLQAIGAEYHALMQLDAYQSELFPFALETLNQLKQQSLLLTITTSKGRPGLDAALHFHHLSALFDATCCGEEYADKPNPAMLNHLLKRFSLTAEECLVVGDTTIDVRFANNANIPCIAVAFGAHSREELQTASPLAIVDGWPELLIAIKTMLGAVSS